MVLTNGITLLTASTHTHNMLMYLATTNRYFRGINFLHHQGDKTIIMEAVYLLIYTIIIILLA